jgi:uncharacterized protein YndB with AHSA1/START domain
MNHNAAFVINENDYSIAIQIDFDANLETTWNAWTKAEFLDQWWAPKPYQTETKALYFTPDGFWLYGMVGPGGDKHYSKADYHTIKDKDSFSFTASFCSEEGKIITDKPRAKWTCSFVETNHTSTLTINIEYHSSADLTEMLDMGFKEGFEVSLSNLSSLISSLR